MSKKKGKQGKLKTRNEVILTFAKYGLFNGIGISQIGESDEIQRLGWFLDNGKIMPYEKPDAYVKVDNQILIIEHFAIDGFDTFPDGGSTYQRYESLADLKFGDMPATETGVHMTTQIGVANSYAGFLKNCKDRFDYHYARIPVYKEHLLSDGIANENTLFTVCFLMDEISPLGTLTHDGEMMRPVCLAHSKEFLEFFSTKPDVDWIISAVVRIPDSGYYPYFFSRQDIDNCREHALDYASFHFLSSEHTMETRFKVNIPMEQ